MSSNGPIPQDQEGFMRWVVKEIRALKRRPGGVANATVTTDGEQVRVPSPTTRVVPTAPPASAPTISVTGSDGGMTVVADGIVDPTTVLDYYLDGVLVTSTRSVVLFWTTDAAGAPMVDGVTYTWQVYARNELGRVASNTVQGTLNMGVASKTVLGWVAAGFVLAGQIQVGNITIDPDGGITIPLANGGLIAFPANGSDAIITAVLRARSLVVENNMRILGPVNLVEGGLLLASGTVAPIVAPRVTSSWSDPTVRLPTNIETTFGALAGAYDNGTNWVVPFTIYGTSLGFVDKTTGLVDYLPAYGAVHGRFSALGGITKIGSYWYLLGQDYDRAGKWYFYIYNSSWVKTGEVYAGPSSTFTARPSIATDGTKLWVAYWGSALSQLVVARYSATGTGLTYETYFHLDTSTDWSHNDTRGLYVGNADFGGARFVVGSATYDTYFAWNNTGGATGALQSRAAANDWVAAAGDKPAGLAWDGTRFHGIADSRTIWHYSKQATSASHAFKHTFYDSVGTTHETDPGPTTTYSPPTRTWTLVDLDPPTDAGGVDDPDSLRVYIDNHRQADLGPGVTTVLYDNYPTAGAGAPGSNGFASVLGQLGTFAATNGGFWVDGESDGDWPGKLTASGTVASGAATTTNASGYVTLAVAPGFTPRQYACFNSNSTRVLVPDMANSTATSIRCFVRDITNSGALIVSTNIGDIRWVAYP